MGLVGYIEGVLDVRHLRLGGLGLLQGLVLDHDLLELGGVAEVSRGVLDVAESAISLVVDGDPSDDRVG